MDVRALVPLWQLTAVCPGYWGFVGLSRQSHVDVGVPAHSSTAVFESGNRERLL